MGRLFFSWKPTCSRSENIAHYFDAKNIYVSPFYGRRGYHWLALRYLVSFFITLRHLFMEKPRFIFTENQPPFLLLAIFLYCLISHSHYILDSHSGAFDDPRWRWFFPVYRFLASRALFNINTNAYHSKLVESWGGKSFIISDVPIDFDTARFNYRKVPEKSVAVVASYKFDEPLLAIWEAARQCSDVHFFVTGDYSKSPEELINNVPPNVHLTGYLPYEEYYGLLASVKGVMALTKRDNTMQRGAYEGLSLETPIITSNWQLLKNVFGKGAVYVNDEPEDIMKGIKEFFSKYSTLKATIKNQRKIRRELFENNRSQILDFLETCDGKAD